MIGQQELLKVLNSYTIQTLPKALMLIGEKGCGKHTVVNELAKKLELEVEELQNSITSDDIIEYQYTLIPKIFVIDLSNFTDKQQNQLLKFVEEPCENVYIVLFAENPRTVIDTLLNRCIKLYFKSYTKDELKQFKAVDCEEIYDICKTPGQLQDVDVESFGELLTLCSKIIQKLPDAPYANAISISTKLNFKEEYNKFDVNLFFNTLLYLARKEYVKSNTKESLAAFYVTYDYKQRFYLPALNKESLVISFLDELYNVVKK